MAAVTTDHSAAFPGLASSRGLFPAAASLLRAGEGVQRHGPECLGSGLGDRSRRSVAVQSSLTGSVVYLCEFMLKCYDAVGVTIGVI